MSASLFYLTFVEQAEKLEREVFECQRRAMEQLKHGQFRRQCDERCHCGIGKISIRLGGQFMPFLGWNFRCKPGEKLSSQRGVTKFTPSIRHARKLWQRVGQKQSSIRCEAGGNSGRESVGLRLSPGGRVIHAIRGHCPAVLCKLKIGENQPADVAFLLSNFPSMSMNASSRFRSSR